MKLQLLNVVRETDDERKIRQLKALGYKEVVAEAAREKPLADMKKDELLAAAAEAGVEVPDGATNADIVKLIEAARAE